MPLIELDLPAPGWPPTTSMVGVSLGRSVGFLSNKFGRIFSLKMRSFSIGSSLCGLRLSAIALSLSSSKTSIVQRTIQAVDALHGGQITALIADRGPNNRALRLVQGA